MSATKTSLRHSAYLSPNFTGREKSAKFGFDVRPQPSLSGRRFERKKVRIGNLKHSPRTTTFDVVWSTKL